MMKYFWPIATFSFLTLLALQEPSVFPILGGAIVTYLLHKNSEKTC